MEKPFGRWRRLRRLAVALAFAMALGVPALVWRGLHDGPARPDILLISIDTLRPDHLESYGYGRDTSRVIQSVAARGTVAEDVVAPLPATDPSHASLLTGLHPLRHGVLTNAVPLRPGVETLAEVLARRGYHTMGATGVYHMGREFGFGRGFAAFSDVRDSGHTEERTADEVDESVYSMLERFGSRQPRQPFFLFVHYFDAHRPYLLRRAGRVSEAVGSVGDLIDGYDSEIRFVDEQIGHLLQRLRQLGLDRKLLVCITADHGEQFGEHGFTGGHADFYRETTRVPLILAGPGVPHGRLQQRISLMDVPVTLAAAAGASFSHRVDGVGFLKDTSGSASAQARPFLVLGYPSYTRSLQVLEGRWAFVLNLESVYRRAFAEPLRHVERRALLADGFQELQPAANARTDRGVWELPALDFAPQAVTAVIQGKQIPCRGEVSLTLDPRISYFKEPLDLGRGLRLRFAGSRCDRIAILVSPARCAEGVFVKTTRYEEAASGDDGSSTSETPLYAGLLTSRKGQAGDELYDVGSDPGMIDSLWQKPERRAQIKRLRDLLESTYRRETGQAGVTSRDWDSLEPHAAEALRSLGYLQ
jgi:arylsulfatase A-like enzyme